MKCSDIKLLLSEYIDETLDENTRSRVDQHFQSCVSCQRDYASLKNIIHETGELPKINAPADFLENLHTRMESRFDLKRIARALFVPFKIKIPLEILTATAAGVLIFLFINIQQPEKSMTDLHYAQKTETLRESSPSEDMRDAEKTSRGFTDNKKTLQQEAPGAQSIKRKQPVKERSRIAASKPAKQQSVAMGNAAPAPTEEQQEAASAGKMKKTELEKPIELALLVEPVPPDTFDTTLADRDKPDQTFKDMASEPVIKKKTSGDESYVHDSQALSASDRAEQEKITEKETKEGMLLEKKLAKDVSQSTAEQIVTIIKTHAGKVISVSVDELTRQPKSILAEIPSSKFKALYSQLNQIGQLKQPAPVIDETKNERLRINILLIPSQ